MANLKINAGVTLHYEVSGYEDGEWLVLSHSLGQSLALWDGQVEELGKSFRLLRYDSRGHGASRGVDGPGSPSAWGQDVVRLLDEVGAEKAHFCGISIGGQVGQWLAIHAAERFNRFVLSNTAPKIGTPEFWYERAALARKDGPMQFVPGSKQRWLTEDFRVKHPGVGEALEAVASATTREGYADGCELLAETDLRPELREVNLQVLCIGGTQDPTTTPEMVEEMASSIPGARYVELNSGHLSCVNKAEEWNTLVMEFLTK